MGYGWGGFTNGQIPYSAMVYCRGAWLEPTAAYWAEALATVFEHERGKPLMFLGFSEGFRVFGQWSDFDNGVRNTQTYYYVRKQRNPDAPAAAYPGGSIHGWALAVDVDLTYLNADDIDWLHTRGRAFGWNWDTTGRPNDEPWHLDFNLTPTEPFDPADYAPQTRTDDDEMISQETIDWLDKKFDALANVVRRESRYRAYKDKSNGQYVLISWDTGAKFGPTDNLGFLAAFAAETITHPVDIERAVEFEHDSFMTLLQHAESVREQLGGPTEPKHA
jgi:D-alanyl-D-alanine carboxypeptidase